MLVAKNAENYQYDINDLPSNFLKEKQIGTSELFKSYLTNSDTTPLFLHGDALALLKELPEQSIDVAMTSPSYWGKRQYAEDGIGLEKNYLDYISNSQSFLI